MKKKFLLTATLVATMTLAAPMVASAAEAGDGSWHSNDKGWWWQYSDGKYVTNDFVEVDGATYYFKADGYMAKGWQKVEKKSENGSYTWTNWYYFESNGAMVKDSWKQINGKWYYFGADGAMYTGTRYVDDKQQVFAPSGQWVHGWTWDSYTDDYGNDVAGWYYANSDGTPYDYDSEDDMNGGWLQSGDKWYYINSWNGQMATGWVTVKDVEYYLNAKGEMVTGWYQTGSDAGDWIYCNADGSVYDGWLAFNGSWYYMNDGRMASNDWIPSEAKNSDVRYYVGNDGKMVTGGWYNTSYQSATYSSTDWIYVAADGSSVTGWVQDAAGKWYYIVRGEMVANTARSLYVNENAYRDADGVLDYQAYRKAVNAQPTYIFDATGAMVTGWYKVTSTVGGQTASSQWYYAGADGVGYNGWVQDGGYWYYIKDGRMLTNQYTPDGYYVGAYGAWQ